VNEQPGFFIRTQVEAQIGHEVKEEKLATSFMDIYANRFKTPYKLGCCKIALVLCLRSWLCYLLVRYRRKILANMVPAQKQDVEGPYQPDFFSFSLAANLKTSISLATQRRKGSGWNTPSAENQVVKGASHRLS
jgi:hypothetical protein